MYSKYSEKAGIQQNLKILPRILIQDNKTRRLANHQVSKQIPIACIDRDNTVVIRQSILADDFQLVVFDQYVDQHCFGFTTAFGEIHVLQQHVLRIDDLCIRRADEKREGKQALTKIHILALE